MIAFLLLAGFFLIGGLPGLAGAVFGLIGHVIKALDEGISLVVDRFKQDNPE